MEHKYVHHNILGFILWPKDGSLVHADIGKSLLYNIPGELVSAGFAWISSGEVSCYGESISLKMKSLPEDSKKLAEQLGLEND